MARGLDLTTYAARGRTPPATVRRAIESVWPPLSVDWQSVGLLVTVGANHVLRTDVDPDAVVDRVTGQSGWSLVAESGTSYPLLARADGAKAIAVAPSALVVARGYGSDRPATATATGIVATERGDVGRYADGNAALRAFLNAVPRGYRIHWRPAARFASVGGPEPSLSGVAGVGWTAGYDDRPRPSVQYHVVFDGSDDVDVAGVRSFVQDHAGEGQLFGGIRDRSIRQAGPIVVVEGVAGE